MGDVLKYRLPNQEVELKHGEFVALETLEGFDGFIVKSFVGNQYYGFQEAEMIDSYSYSSEGENPVCYSKEEYLDLANKYISEFKNSRASKAILSRIKKFEFLKNPKIFFNALCEKYPSAFVYLISSKEFGTWIGATPEILVSIEDRIGKTMALAGTRVSGRGIEWTEKERNEQQFVTDYIVSKLEKLNVPLLKTDGPNSIVSGPVEHLRTDFEFKLNNVRQIELIETLHPTPAVCGLPLYDSYEMISEIEAHDRILYTGLIGCVGAKTELYVNLRCAQIIEDECYLYVGGGLTIDSNPEHEWIETENKAKTLLNVIENL